MSNVSKITLLNGNTYDVKDNSQTVSDHRHHDDDIVPLISKVYESTSYYATTGSDWNTSSWYFMSVRPDSWYKPWRVKFKVHSFCPNYPNVDSYTWCEWTGRADSIAYANWNERYDLAHYYMPCYALKKVGYDAGYSHAIGVSILYGTGYTNSAYFRTFEVDYYECENCTVTILDTPVKWADWVGTGSTNYNTIVGPNAVDRGLQETGDANTVVDNRINYFPGKTGSKGVWATSLFMEDVNGTYQNICTASDGTVTSSNRTTTTTKIANTNGFKVGGKVYYTNTSYAANTNISGGAVVWSSISLFDSRYALNTTLTANSLTPFVPLYLVGTIHSDGLYYLDTVWWTQTPNDTSKVYVHIGACWDSTTSNCRITLHEENIWYRYDGEKLVEVVNGHTVESDVPADAKFTDTTYAVTRTEINSVNKGADIAVDDITSWSAGSITSASVTGTTLNITNGSAPSLTYTEKNVPSFTVSKKMVVSKVEEPNPNAYYGMIIHQAISNPASRVEYIGINQNYTPMSVNFNTGVVSYGDWADMPTIANNKPAMVKTDGTLDYLLNESNYRLKEDGTASDVSNLNYDGNAFSWFEPIWMSVTTSGTDLEIRFAYSQLDNTYFEVCPHECGAWLPMFYGYASGSSAATAKMRSIANTSVLGAKTGNTTSDAQNVSIKNNGSNYYFLGGKLLEAIKWLQIMWFKSTNSDDWGRGNQDGYDSTDTTTYGTKVNPVVDGGQFYLTSDGKSANKILHSIPLATYDVYLRNPYVLTIDGVYYVSKDYSYSATGQGYTNTGITAPTSNGYQKSQVYVDGFGCLPSEVGATSSTYYSDYYYISTSGTRMGLSLGYCNFGRDCGCSYLVVSIAASYSNWTCACSVVLAVVSPF